MEYSLGSKDLFIPTMLLSLVLLILILVYQYSYPTSETKSKSPAKQLLQTNWSPRSPSYRVDQLFLKDPRVTTTITGTPQISIQYNYHYNQQDLHSALKQAKKRTVYLNLPYNYWIGNKAELWRTLTYSQPNSSWCQVIPKCYLIPQEYSKFVKELDSGGEPESCTSPNHLWIFKSKLQRQKGLYLYKKSPKGDLHQIPNLKWLEDKGIIVAQEYLDNPLLYRGHKINLRLYLIVCLSAMGPRYWLSNDGVVYYTPEKYQSPTQTDDPNTSFEFDRHICSFYKSKPLYDQGFPVVWSDLLKDEERQRVIEREAFESIEKVVQAYYNRLKKEGFRSWIKDHCCFEFFGVDFHMQRNGLPKLIEINMGPGLTPYNEKDAQVRAQAIKFYHDLIMREASR